MIEFIWTSFAELMTRGGKIMWPLLLLCLVGLTLVIERAWFWARINSASRLRRVAKMASCLRQGKTEDAQLLAQDDSSVYGQVVLMLLSEPYSAALATDAVESQRRRLERFMPTLSTIITAAPMFGILGTVTGIIASFQVLSNQAMATDPNAVSAGIAEALLTTVAGLVVALMVLFPYNAFRAQIEWTLSRIETLAAAAGRTAPAKPVPPPSAK